MLTSLFRRLFRRPPPLEKSDAHADTLASVSANPNTSPPETHLPQEPPLAQEPPIASTSSIENIETSIICREAVLNRQ
ncbi:MAG: hypothetical protein LBV29_01080, partial [Azoarcus sp.]|nr:hypothetical protein [Azoarcus sp.]